MQSRSMSGYGASAPLAQNYGAAAPLAQNFGAAPALAASSLAVPAMAGPGFGGIGGPLLATPGPGPGFGGMGSIDPLNRVYGGPFQGPFAHGNGGPWAGPFRANANNINPRGARFRG